MTKGKGMKFLLFTMLLAAGAVLASGLSTQESSADGIVFELSAPQPEFKTILIRGDNYSTVAMAGASNTSEFSLPRLPVYRKWL